MGGTILHVNAVGLMAAIEENDDRSLRRRPFVVAREGLSRAVILDLSPGAHREGLRRGMFLAAARRNVPGLEVRAPRPERYREADETMWRIALSLTPMVERAGRGHLYVDLAGTGRLYGPPEDASMRFRLRIMDELGLAPSLALASTKTVSKVATRVFRPGGFVALRPHEESDIVRLQPVELLPGVGPVLRERLALLEIEDIGSLADLKPFEARAIGARGPELVVRARGIDESPVDPEPPEHRKLEAGTVLEPDSADMDFIRLLLLRMIPSLGYEARRGSLGAKKIGVLFEYSDGRGSAAFLRSPRLLTRDDELVAAAWEAARRACSRRVRIRRLTVRLSELGAAGPELDLFDPVETRIRKLQAALDGVHRKHGFASLVPGTLLAAGCAGCAAAGEG